MSNDIDRDASQEEAPTRLTRRALFDLRLEEMRQRGESTDGMSQLAPTISWPKEDSEVRVARNLALMMASPINQNPNSSWMVAERERQKRQEAAWKEEMDREESELRRNTSAAYDAPCDTRTCRSTVSSPYSNHTTDEGTRDRYQYTGHGPRRDARGMYPTSDDSPHSNHTTSQRADDQFQYSGCSQRLSNNTDARLSGHANNGSDWRHSSELGHLQKDMLDAAKFRPEMRSLYRTFDMNAFTGDPAHDDNKDAPKTAEATSSSTVPSFFPRHNTIDSLIDVGAYLASSSYIVSLGGSPVPDLKYGIIIVPAGEEALLFAGHGDDAAMSPDLLEEIHTKSKKAQKEQMEEFRHKAAGELADESDWKPDLDDQERDFYRQRWWDRAGRNRHYSSRLSDYMANRERRRQFERRDRTQPIQGSEMEFQSPSSIGHRKRRSIHTNSRASGRNVHNDDARETNALTEPDQSPNYNSNGSPPSPIDNYMEAGHILYVEECGSQEEKVSEQDWATIQSNSRASSRGPKHHDPLETTTDVKIDQAQDRDGHKLPNSETDKVVEAPPISPVGECDPQEQALVQTNPSITSRGSRASNREACNSVPTKTDAHVKPDEAPSCNGVDENTNSQARPSASTEASSQNTALKESMSHEACQTLELLLGKKKRRGVRGVLKSMLPNSRARASSDPNVTRRDVLLEIGKAMTSLANGELHDNPGIDRRIWEAARNDLAVRA